MDVHATANLAGLLPGVHHKVLDPDVGMHQARIEPLNRQRCVENRSELAEPVRFEGSA
jgi:hypothetical protein